MVAPLMKHIQLGFILATVPLCALPPLNEHQRELVRIETRGYSSQMVFIKEDAYYEFSPQYRLKISEYMRKKREQEKRGYVIKILNCENFKLRKNSPDSFICVGSTFLGILAVIGATMLKFDSLEEKKFPWLGLASKTMLGALGLGAFYWGTNMEVRTRINNYRYCTFQKYVQNAEKESKTILDAMTIMANDKNHVRRITKDEWKQGQQLEIIFWEVAAKALADASAAKVIKILNM
jgi:hypothetical protein